MSYGSNSGGGTTTTEIPAWLRDEYQQNIDRAEGIANQGFTPYGGQLTAGGNDYTGAAADQAVGAAYAGTGLRNQATKVLGEITDQSPYFQNAEQLAGSDLSAYQNPYQQQVIDASLGDIQRQQDRQLNSIDASTPRGAFGGDRQGVERALTREAYGRQMADTVTGLRSQGFDRATGLASQDVDRRTNNNQFNAGLDNQNTAFNLQGAQGLLGAAQQQQGQALSASDQLLKVGLSQQGTQQADLDARYQEFLRGQQDPITRQGVVNQAVLGISNAGGTTSSTANSKAKGF